LSSSRRVKIGPGRRPQSAKRERFVELRARGWSISAAGHEVGVSRTAANNWARGYKTYRRGEVVGFVPALDRLAVRQISDRYLSEEERIGIADLRRTGMSVRQIAATLGRAPSTVSREFGSCAATAAATASTGRLKPTAGRFNAEPVVTRGGSIRTPPCVT
jgi:transposase, IS30 family